MNDPTLIGPCAEYEHDLVDLHDGDLPPQRAGVVRLHVAQCARCRDWAQAFAALDAHLAADLPRAELSAGFEANLHARLAALAQPVVRGDLHAALEREHHSLIAALRRGARRNAVLGAIGSAAVAACALLAARGALVETAGALAPLTGSSPPWMVFGVTGVAIAIVALAWSSARGLLPLPGLAQ